MNYDKKFMQPWTKRIGPEAARLSPIGVRLMALGGCSVPVWVGVRWLGDRTHSGPVQLVGTILEIADFVVVVAEVIAIRQMYRAMSRFLGLHVTFLNSPTLREADWRRWCERNQIAADPRADTAASSPERP
jgi:hypothetical protein